MDNNSAREVIKTLVTTWFDARVSPEARNVVTINEGGFDNAANTAHSHVLLLNSQLVDSDGIDAHMHLLGLMFNGA